MQQNTQGNLQDKSAIGNIPQEPYAAKNSRQTISWKCQKQLTGREHPMQQNILSKVLDESANATYQMKAPYATKHPMQSVKWKHQK